MPSDVTLSIILPTYNRGRVLGDAVASVLDQTFTDFELLIVDDASRTEERPRSAAFGDPRIQIIERAHNGGVASAQNTGLARASAEFVGFIHSDDLWSPTKAESQIARLRSAGTDVVAVESATKRLTDRGAEVVTARTAEATYADLLERRVRNLHVGGFLFRRQALGSVGGFDEDLRAYEDLDLLIRLRQRGLLAVGDEVVATIDQRGTDRLASSPWMHRGREHLLDKYEAELLARGPELPAGWRDWSAQAAITALESGDRRLARHRLRRSMGRQPRLWVRRAPLLAATYAGDRGGRRAATAYRRRRPERP